MAGILNFFNIGKAPVKFEISPSSKVIIKLFLDIPTELRNYPGFLSCDKSGQIMLCFSYSKQ